MTVYDRTLSLEQAAEEVGFEKDDTGRLGMAAGYMSWTDAMPYRTGRFRGIAAYPMFRGFIRDPALLAPEESHVFSGESAHVLLKERAGGIVLFTCLGGAPDVPIDCHATIRQVARSLRFR